LKHCNASWCTGSANLTNRLASWEPLANRPQLHHDSRPAGTPWRLRCLKLAGPASESAGHPRGGGGGGALHYRPSRPSRLSSAAPRRPAAPAPPATRPQLCHGSRPAIVQLLHPLHLTAKISEWAAYAPELRTVSAGNLHRRGLGRQPAQDGVIGRGFLKLARRDLLVEGVVGVPLLKFAGRDHLADGSELVGANLLLAERGRA